MIEKNPKATYIAYAMFNRSLVCIVGGNLSGISNAVLSRNGERCRRWPQGGVLELRPVRTFYDGSPCLCIRRSPILACFSEEPGYLTGSSVSLSATLSRTSKPCPVERALGPILPIEGQLVTLLHACIPLMRLTQMFAHMVTSDCSPTAMDHIICVSSTQRIWITEP